MLWRTVCPGVHAEGGVANRSVAIDTMIIQNAMVEPLLQRPRVKKLCFSMSYIIMYVTGRIRTFEKGYGIKNVVTFLRRQFPGKQQCWCQIWHPKSGIHVLRVYICVWKVWCKSGQFFFRFWPLTLNDLDLDQIWPHRNEPLKGNSRVSLHTLTKFCEIGP
jgi:hypothetical protein